MLYHIEWVIAMVTFDVSWEIYADNMPVHRNVYPLNTNCIFIVFTANTNWYSTMVSTLTTVMSYVI